MIVQMHITIGLSVINVFLLLSIIWVNWCSYCKLRAEYTLFSMVFAALFLSQYIAGGALYFTNMALYPDAIANHMLILTAIQTVAFSYLVWMEVQ